MSICMKNLISLKLSVLLPLIFLAFGCAAMLPPSTGDLIRNDAALLQQADNFYRAHRYNEALATYEQYLQTSPQGVQWQHAWLRTAELYGIKGDWLQARARYERILAVPVDSGLALKARYGVGQAQYKLGNFLEAERILENLTASNLSGDLRFKTNALLTELSLQSRNFPQACSRLLLVEKDLPYGEEEWYQDLKSRLLERATAPELEKLADLYRDTPLTPALLLQLIRLETQAGRPEKAEEWLATLQRRFPQSPEAVLAAKLSAPPTRTEAVGSTAAIGCLLPLSGEYAEVGHQVKNGLELAALQAHMSLAVEDCGSGADPTVAALEKLANDPKIVALIGFFPSAVAEAAAAAAQRLGVPLLALTQKKDVTQTGSFIFQDFLRPPLMLQALVSYTGSRMGWQRYAIICPDSKYGRTMARQFAEELNKHGMLLVSQVSYAEDGHNLAQAVQTLTTVNPGPDGRPSLDAVFIPDEDRAVAAVASVLASTSQFRMPLLGTNILHTPSALQHDARLDGIFFPDGFFAGDPDPAVRAFVSDYQQQFQQTPSYLAAQGYSSLRLAGEALQGSPGIGRGEFAQKLSQQLPPPGFTLFKSFNTVREAQLAIKILTIRGQEFQLAP